LYFQSPGALASFIQVGTAMGLRGP
jgi:hypothetical protein